MEENLLHGSRAYLSGPMDFVGSRLVEKYLGWRAILTPVLRALGVTVLDPWNKPVIRGHFNYGQEGVFRPKAEYEKDFWTNPETRVRFEKDFWETVHIDLRMTDLSDFLMAFVPTNIYSVGTVHEIVVAREQHKPTLMISPPIKYEFFPELAALPEPAKQALKFYGLKENHKGIPSQWYGNIVGGNNMFDGFGWEGLRFKSGAFYPELLRSLLAGAEPKPENKREHKRWSKVKEWVEHHRPLQELRGGILDHITCSSEEERGLLEKELAGKEAEREYFWYNQPYTPQRPVLYQLLSIAAGVIPPRIRIIPMHDEEGEVHYRSYEVPDDSWLLLKPDASV